MTGWPAQPVIHEVDTWVWLTELGPGRTLGDVPTEAWDQLALPGVDAVWLMGVWERSPAGLEIALRDEQLQAAFRAALPDLAPGDVVGSPYCVRRYVVDPRLGGPAGLAAARAELARRGVRLLLDYVPNHVAPDHPWVRERPEVFVRGGPEDLAREPEAFLDAGGPVLARGRDPYFPPWPDVVQLDAFSPRLRDASVETLQAIGDQCDGVRCDMAMLLLTDVFAKTWGDRVGPAPAAEFWPEVLGRVRERHPDMLFVAEAYWDLEWTLQQQGFDHCYDKRLYDRLLGGDASSVRGHLRADVGYQRRLVRFLENHDEPRAAATLRPVERERAAAVAIATLPGATLWHEGQLDGRRVQLPVFLGRRPAEPLDAELRRFHTDLIAAVASAGLRAGEWQGLDCTGWPDNPSYLGIVAWCWRAGDRRHLVVVNLSDQPAQARVPVPWPDLRGRTWRLLPVLAGETFERAGDELTDPGLFVALPPWGWHVLAFDHAERNP
ncbi:MAG TPA: alpha-amylase [Actinoplanes sp.]|nr:alpha-amylase [Actinoplanes sp.]